MAKKKSAFEQKLDEKLDALLKDALPDMSPFALIHRDLKNIAQSINRRAFKGSHGMLVDVEPGFSVNVGQQFNVVVRIPKLNYRDVLFRAYIPPQGYPVALDLNGEFPIPCETELEFHDAIFSFLGRQEIIDRMRMYKEIGK